MFRELKHQAQGSRVVDVGLVEGCGKQLVLGRRLYKESKTWKVGWAGLGCGVSDPMQSCNATPHRIESKRILIRL